MIVATAGHVDHGKTSLIKALTGTDTDRLPEERRRGMSIDLGFAYLASENGASLAFVDVPGHEKFIRNMIAGVTGIDVALIVVAADDGPMPQTMEHIQILDLLGVRSAAVALTKIDLVTDERINVVKRQIDACLDRTGMRGAPIIPVTVKTQAGIEALKRHLSDMATHYTTRPTLRSLRINVDRAFSLKGIGLIATGTVVTGSVCIGDEVMLIPGGEIARVRSIHANNREHDRASQGQRCALNLSGAALDPDRIARGHTIVAPDFHRASLAVDVEVKLTLAAPGAQKAPSSITVFAGTQSGIATLHALEKLAMQAGQPFLARIAFHRETVCFCGDRLLFRDTGSNRLIGGAVVIDPFPPRRGKNEPERLALLRRIQPDSPTETFDRLLQTGSGLVNLDWLVQTYHLTAAERNALACRQAVKLVSGENCTLAIDRVHWEAFLSRSVAQVAQWHEDQPESVGVKPVELQRLFHPLEHKALPAAIEELASARRLERDRAWLRLPGYRPRLRAADHALWRRMQPYLARGGLRPPRVVELAELMSLERHVLEPALARIAKSEAIFQVAKNRFFLPETLSRLASIAEQLAAESPDQSFNAAQFRDRSELGRNLTIEVLEFFDSIGFCKREGESRKILQPAPAFFRNRGLELINGRETLPVERAGFKPVGGCMTSLGSSTLSSSAR